MLRLQCAEQPKDYVVFDSNPKLGCRIRAVLGKGADHKVKWLVVPPDAVALIANAVALWDQGHGLSSVLRYYDHTHEALLKMFLGQHTDRTMLYVGVSNNLGGISVALSGASVHILASYLKGREAA